MKLRESEQMVEALQREGKDALAPRPEAELIEMVGGESKRVARFGSPVLS